MKTISSIDLKNKKVLIRVDFNVPLNEKKEITDKTRILAALPTIKYILEQGGSAILMSHLGRPKNGPEEKFSLRPIAKELEKLIGKEVHFANDCIGYQAKEMAASLKKGELLLLENLRFYPEEKKGDKDFAEQLSQLADIYVNDAFGTAHRAHASTAVISQFFPGKKCFGLLLQKEIENMDYVLHEAKKPTIAIIGGAKVSSKIGIIQRLLNSVDQIIIGGGMAYTFIKAKGGSIGNSLVEEEYLDLALKTLKEAEEKNVQVLLPIDTIIADEFSETAETDSCIADAILDGWMGLDIGELSIQLFKSKIKNARTILWNGPMGVFEMEKFAVGTRSIAESIAEMTKNGGYSLVGGGDSVAAINQLGFQEEVSYISTGGGAMLEYLEGKVLPGIQAINEE